VLAVFIKEINGFFSSLMGYLTMGLFLLVMGLFLFVFPDTSILNYGEASLDYFFNTAPWIFIFLIPAITMRMFSEELKSGTIELLTTRPLTKWQIIGGKYLAAVALLAMALLPTLCYYYTIWQLGATSGNIDTGATNGSYIGLLLLGGAFTSIGIFTSSLTRNQIVAFILGVFLCFFFYMAFDFLSRTDVFYASLDDIVEKVGIFKHYESISRGVIDSRDVVYFASFIGLFLFFTKLVLDARHS